MYNRRKFLGGLVASGIYLVAQNPTHAQSPYQSSSPSYQVTIEARLGNTNDRLRQTFDIAPDNNLFLDVGKKVHDFFSQYGIKLRYDTLTGPITAETTKQEVTDKRYDQLERIASEIEARGIPNSPPDLDAEKLLNFIRRFASSLKPQSLSPASSSLYVSLYHTTWNDLKAFYTINPKQFFLDTQGQDWVKTAEERLDKIRHMLKGVNLPGFSLNGTIEQTWQEKFKKAWEEYTTNQTHNGMGSKYTQRVYTTPLDPLLLDVIQNDSEHANVAAVVQAHEIGHALGLWDTRGYGKNNLMNVGSMVEPHGKTKREKLRPMLEFNVTLDTHQVKAMLDFLDSLHIK